MIIKYNEDLKVFVINDKYLLNELLDSIYHNNSRIDYFTDCGEKYYLLDILQKIMENVKALMDEKNSIIENNTQFLDDIINNIDTNINKQCYFSTEQENITILELKNIIVEKNNTITTNHKVLDKLVNSIDILDKNNIHSDNDILLDIVEKQTILDSEQKKMNEELEKSKMKINLTIYFENIYLEKIDLKRYI